MREYHKIQSVFMRDPTTKHRTFLEGQFAMPEFEYLAGNKWVWTEKIDGTNIRVHWDGENVRFGGRTDNAQIPAFLIERLQDRFPVEKMREVFGDRGGLTLYGEGYGARIQKGGGDYIPDGVDFILFDILGGEMWFERAVVEDDAKALGVDVVPIIGNGTIAEAVDLTAEGFQSEIGAKTAEGIVLRPACELVTRRGQRVIAKLKHRDFQDVAKAA